MKKNNFAAGTRFLVITMLSGVLLLPAIGKTATDARETATLPPALPTETTVQCRDAASINVGSLTGNKAAAYKSGFQYGCHFFEDKVFYAKTTPPPAATTLLFSDIFAYITPVTDRESLICTVARAEKEFGLTGGDRNAWASGCGSGLDEGDQIYTSNMAGHPPLVIDKNNIRHFCQTASSGSSQPTEFTNGCIKSYYAWMYRPITGDPTVRVDNAQLISFTSSLCVGGTTFFNNGCLAGAPRANQDYDDALPVTGAPSGEIVSFVENPEIGTCGYAPLGADSNEANHKDGYYEGCYRGYFRGLNHVTAKQDCELGHARYSRGSKQRAYDIGFIDACYAGFDAGAAQFNRCTASGRTPPFDPLPSQCGAAPVATDYVNHGGIVPNCNPTLAPNAAPDINGNPPCGVNKLVELINNIMKYIFMISLPIAVLVIGWGGFQIMTAAGNQEKVSAGIASMKLTVIGIVIMLASYFIVQAIFKILGVVNFAPGGI